ncbi:SirB1 family protein [Sphingomonas qomolangmaensis]|uniref:Transglutaminase-like domain-containing protein n=1 Tax=Sphingomonas qomolangmaensis TaxID=2918765 RepID=A0ABY5L918_9SPHN|nr:transglutaminase-like domain-containing protein [Sphingomonas qomolangmaensis]UUL83277.1 transglutaminase-like domain-containing protein [Sphingomonas qomolangmaensis]
MNDDLIQLGLIDDAEILLADAALALALLDHPDTNPAPYYDMIEAAAVRLEAMNGGATDADDRADSLAAVFGDELGFVGDEQSYDDPANADLIRVIDRRRGLPISLSIVYVAAARRLGWEANILDVPGHVLVMVGTEVVPVIVDPFRGGARVGRERLAAMVAASVTGAPAAAAHVSVMPNRAVLVRLLLNQASRAERAGKGRRALELYHRMTIVAPSFAQPWWERARLEMVDGDIAGARVSLTAMLEITRDPAVRQRVTDTLRGLPVA